MCPYTTLYLTDDRFRFVVDYAASNHEYVQNWSRLRGITMATDALSAAIDDATGRTADVGRLFMADVHDLIWSRLKKEDE